MKIKIVTVTEEFALPSSLMLVCDEDLCRLKAFDFRGDKPCVRDIIGRVKTLEPCTKDDDWLVGCAILMYREDYFRLAPKLVDKLEARNHKVTHQMLSISKHYDSEWYTK